MKNKLFYYIVPVLLFILTLNSCKKEYEDIYTIDERAIKEYVAKSGLNYIKDPSGFYYSVISAGTGNKIENTDSVFYTYNLKSIAGNEYYKTPTGSNSADYLGYLSSSHSLAYFGDSFRTAISQVKRGGKVHIIIPSYMAYGKNGRGQVPSNTILTSEISVLTQTSQSDIDDMRIKEYLTAKGIHAIRMSSGIYFEIIKQGNGIYFTELTSIITAKYEGRYLDGTIFDKSTDDTFTANLNGAVIKGWTKGLLNYSEGTKIRLFIPSQFAYGNEGKSPIPPNMPLDFDIELVKVTND